MGINSKALIYFFEMVEVLEVSATGANVCCLGNLYLRKYANILLKKYCDTKNYFLYFSDFLKSRGFDVVNLDINGVNSIQVDLRKPIDNSLVGKFDICLDGGTAEHIKDSQYELFRNINKLCKKDGVMIHILPTVEWGHSYWFYPLSFFQSLAQANGYTIFDYRKTPIDFSGSPYKETLFITLIKKTDNEFINEEKFISPSIDKIGCKRFMEANDNYEKWIEDSWDGKSKP